MKIKQTRVHIYLIIFSFAVFGVQRLNAQTEPYKTVQVNVDEEYQTITGFGASLAFYENWLTAHPNKAEIYDVIFSELSLDILRVRNAHGYDSGMIGRVKEFARAAEKSLGHPIDILLTDRKLIHLKSACKFPDLRLTKEPCIQPLKMRIL